MGYRTLRDTDGSEWQIWEVKPVWTERRAADRRAADSPQLPPGQERRSGDGDRREGFDPSRPRISPGLELGWLAFASERERRRIAPAPAGWEDMPDEALLRLCASAAPCPSRRERSLG